ncbi:MAG: hypothetical protein M1816_002703 [Peltula sp. TS41687]|nr:MAG: hypothetical protein M1816_002703 [Peltula sp. TS41687]
MPYTPPTQPSPVGIKPHSPTITRSHSTVDVVSQATSPTHPEGRPTFPRAFSSTSYLSRHRRTPSLSKSSKGATESNTITSPTKEAKTRLSRREVGSNPGPTRSSSSIHQSPPPVNGAVIPPGAIVSPPDSMQTSSDDEPSPRTVRGRPLENLAELQEAIRNIEQHRSSSPEGIEDEDDDTVVDGHVTSPSSNALLGSRAMRERTRSTLPLSRKARKISHSRSSTESSIVMDLGGKSPSSAEDTETESDSRSRRPAMIRKKSGELVKPALRPSTYRRPSSMPGTPTYAKAVHFDARLEHVRHFLQVDRPLAVSVGSSPADNYDSEDEFPFGQDDPYPSRAQSFDWEITTSNFPADTPQRRSLPVRVERVFLSSDKQTIIGSIAVANLCYHKVVVARFTLDYWKTTSEVKAEFSHDVRRKNDDGHDRFNFNIKLADLANLEDKTLFFCVRYNAGGQEFWDNNNHMNFEVSFKKVAKSSNNNNKQAVQGLGARPLSRLRSSASSTGRPWSMPASFDDFADGFDTKFDYTAFTQSAPRIVTDAVSATAKRGNEEDTSKSAKAPLPDYPTRRNNTTSQAFGNRYDFGASLSAAIQAANTDSRKASTKSTSNGNARSSISTPAVSPTTTTSPKITTVSPNPTPTNKGTSTTGVTFSSSGGGSTPSRSTGLNAAPLSRPESYITEKPSQESSLYMELIDKYCFVRSGAAPPRIVAEPT